MNRDVKKIVLVIAGIVLSIFLAALALGLAVTTPGDYITHWIFPTGVAGASYDLGLVVFVHIATDSFCCFVGLLGIYLLLARDRRKGDSH